MTKHQNRGIRNNFFDFIKSGKGDNVLAIGRDPVQPEELEVPTSALDPQRSSFGHQKV